MVQPLSGLVKNCPVTVGFAMLTHGYSDWSPSGTAEMSNLQIPAFAGMTTTAQLRFELQPRDSASDLVTPRPKTGNRHGRQELA